jgi:hypothetical protein
MSCKLKTYLILIIIFSSLSSALLSQEKPRLQRKSDIIRKKYNFAQGLLDEQNNPQAQDLLTTAGMNLRRADRQMRGRRPFRANRSLNMADNSINQGLKILLKNPMMARKRKLDELAISAENAVIGSENFRARVILNKGLKNKKLAYEAYKRNNFFQSMRLYNLSHQQLLKAINLVSFNKRDLNVEFENESYRYNQFLEFNKEIINSNKNQKVIRFKDSAFKKVREAEQAKQDGNYQLAINQYQEATRLLNRALDITLGKKETPVNRTLEKVAQLDELLENIVTRHQQVEPNEEIKMLMSRIKQLQAEAHQAVENSNYGIALNKAQLALDLVNKIHKKSKKPRKNL